MFNLAFLEELAPTVSGNVTAVRLPTAFSVYETWSVRFVLRPRSSDDIAAILASAGPETQHRFSAGQLYIALEGEPEKIAEAVRAVVQHCSAPTAPTPDVPYVPRPTLLPLIASHIWENPPKWPDITGHFPAMEDRASAVPLLIVTSGPSAADLDAWVVPGFGDTEQPIAKERLVGEPVTWKAPNTLQKRVPGNRSTFILAHPVEQTDTGPAISQLVAHQHLFGGAGSLLWDIVRDGLGWCYDVANLPFHSPSASLNITTFSTAMNAEVVLERLGRIPDDPRSGDADVAMSGFMRWMSAGRFDGSIIDIVTNLIATTPHWNDIQSRLVELASLSPAAVGEALKQTLETRGYVTVFSGSGS